MLSLSQKVIISRAPIFISDFTFFFYFSYCWFKKKIAVECLRYSAKFLGAQILTDRDVGNKHNDPSSSPA